MTNWHLNFLHRMLTLFTFNHKHTCLQTKISNYLRNRNWNYNIVQLQIFLEKLILYVYVTLFIIFWRPTVDCKRCETHNESYTMKKWSQQTESASLSYPCFFHPLAPEKDSQIISVAWYNLGPTHGRFHLKSSGVYMSGRFTVNSPTPTRWRIKLSRDVGELVVNPIQLIRS